jgi:hypothetical protein
LFNRRRKDGNLGMSLYHPQVLDLMDAGVDATHIKLGSDVGFFLHPLVTGIRKQLTNIFYPSPY